MFSSVIDLLQLLGIGQCLFAAALLGLSSRHAEPTDRWLSAALLVVTGSDVLALAERELPAAADMLRAANLFDLAFAGPTLWMHLWHLMGAAPGEHPGRRWHLAPIGIAAAGAVPVAAGLPGFGFALYLFVQGQQGAYLLAILRRARRHAAVEGTDRLRIRWTLRVVAVLAMVWALNLAETAIRVAGLAWPGLGPLMELPPIIGFFLVSLLAFERPREIIARVENRVIPMPVSAAEKYRRSGLQAEARNRLAERLRRALAEEAVLADAAMTLPRMAKALNASENDLSQVANQVFGRRFPDLLAAARIGLAMRRLRDPAFAEETVLEVAMAVGFNSKSTFNAAFKREAGVTPTAWRAGEGSGEVTLEASTQDRPAA